MGVHGPFLYTDILLALAYFLHLSLIYDINLHCHLLTMCKYLDLTLAARPRALPVGRNPLAVSNDPRKQSRFEALVVSPQPTSYLRLTLITDCSSTNPMSTISSTMLSPLPNSRGQPHPPGPRPKSGSISETSSRPSLRSMLS